MCISCNIVSSFHCHMYRMEFKMPPAKKQMTPAHVREIQVHKLCTNVYSQKGLTAMLSTHGSRIKSSWGKRQDLDLAACTIQHGALRWSDRKLARKETVLRPQQGTLNVQPQPSPFWYWAVQEVWEVEIGERLWCGTSSGGSSGPSEGWWCASRVESWGRHRTLAERWRHLEAKFRITSNKCPREQLQWLICCVKLPVWSCIRTWCSTQNSGAAWKLRWPSWAPRPNEPYGFCGLKATLNHSLSLI